MRRVTEQAVQAFFAHRSPQTAAGVSYYALFSLFPIAILSTAVFTVAVDDELARERIVELVLQTVPLTQGEGRRRLERVLETTAANTQAFGVVGVAGLLFAASGLVGALRHGVNTAWDIETRRPPVRGKALDVLLVLGTGIPVALSLVLTFVSRLVDSLGDRAIDVLGLPGWILPRLLVTLPVIGSLVLSFAIFAFLYSVLPAVEARFRDVWPGATIAAVGYELAKLGFSFYLEGFGNFDAVYGSLGAVIALLLFVFIAANLFLFGAEVAAKWPAVGEDYGRPDEPSPPLLERLRQLGRGLVHGSPDSSDEASRRE